MREQGRTIHILQDYIEYVNAHRDVVILQPYGCRPGGGLCWILQHGKGLLELGRRAYAKRIRALIYMMLLAFLCLCSRAKRAVYGVPLLSPVSVDKQSIGRPCPDVIANPRITRITLRTFRILAHNNTLPPDYYFGLREPANWVGAEVKQLFGRSRGRPLGNKGKRHHVV